MSNLSYQNRRPKYSHILVFDTIALLSAREDNPIQDWRNNEQLGACYIPGATYAEIAEIANSRKNIRNKANARKFLEFIAKGGHYKVLPSQDNRNIPIKNDSDRQVLACAHQLATEHKNSIVILVTYDLKKMGLVVQSHLPNFCMIEAKDIAKWFHNGYFQNQLPEPIQAAYAKMQGNNQANYLPGNQGGRMGDIAGQNSTRRLPTSDNSKRKNLEADESVITVNSSNSSSSQRPKESKQPSLPTSSSSNPKDRTLIISSIVLVTFFCLAFLGVYLINKNPDSRKDPATGIVIPK